MTLREFLSKSARNLRDDPSAATGVEITREFVHGATQRTVGKHVGTPIWELEADWDVMCVLDACRVDLMEEVAPEYGLGPVESYRSTGSCSPSWIGRTFNRDLPADENVAYVTANPFTDYDRCDFAAVPLADDQLAHLEEPWKEHWQQILGGVEAVPPSVLVDRTIDVWRHREQLDIDRVVVHFMQPHQPFRLRPDWSPEDEPTNLGNLFADNRAAGACIWRRLQHGELTHDEVWEAYRENLRWVLDDITDRLVTNCDATIALSADHGNAMGEKFEWGHPPGVLTPEVRRVPLVAVEGVDERTVMPTVGPVLRQETQGAERDVSDQLEALGYA